MHFNKFDFLVRNYTSWTDKCSVMLGFYPTTTVAEGSHLFQGRGSSWTLFSVGFYHSASSEGSSLFSTPGSVGGPGRRSNWKMAVWYWKVLPLRWCGPNIEGISWLFLQLQTIQNINADLQHGFKWQSMTWPWYRQKVKLRTGCVLLLRSNPKIGVGQILKLYLEYFSSYVHFSKLKHKT